MDAWLTLLAIGVAAFSGVPGLLLSRHTTTGQQATTVLAALAAGLGMAGIVVFWATAGSQPVRLAWPIAGADFHVALDGLSAVFLMPIFLISLLGNVYGLAYWRQTDHTENARKLRLFYGTLTAGMALLVIARNSIWFLVGWEVMSLSAFFLVNTEDNRADVRQTAWIYLVATHVATLSLFALFALMRKVAGSFNLEMLPADELTPGIKTSIFVLALVGFGLKAGIMPLHVWLPSAHAIAPSHVSAIMSGVIIKMGIYGLARVLSLVPQTPVEWGAIVLALGAVSGVFGVVFAIGQHDLKRLLAYHSIENIGIIVMGLGLALIGRSMNRAEWIVLGLGGALLHVWNHALFKALLFLSAGSVIHAVHTREIDRLGGIAKSMPQTAWCFLVGAIAICGLPPLNGFVSEFLIYLGLFRAFTETEGEAFAGAALAAPALALIGALAVACFIKVFAAVFLGTARSEPARHAHESPPPMIGPMAALVMCCLVIGLVPLAVAPVLAEAAAAWAPQMRQPGERLEALAPLGWITVMGFALLAALLAGAFALRGRLRRGAVDHAGTWGCGYVAPTSRMQYTASSFAQTLVDLFAWVLRPRAVRPEGLMLFPQKASFHSEVPDTVLDEAVLPSFRWGAWLMSCFRVVQQGSVQAYVMYIFVILLGLLLWR